MADRSENRRTRLDPDVDPQLRAWLTETTRIHSGLCYVVRLLGRPKEAAQRAGGQTAGGRDYAERVQAGDPSILHDALALALDQTTDLMAKVQAHMDDAPPTDHPPGSPGKVQAMVTRSDQGRSLFIPGDRQIDVS